MQRTATPPLAALLAPLVCLASQLAIAAERNGRHLHGSAACGCPACATASWHSVETANFRILNFGARPVTAETTAACERLREQIVGCWLEGTAEAWSPKCTIVLHPTDRPTFARSVQGVATLSLVAGRSQAGANPSRRVDIRATQANWQTAALGHELTHIVLADRFAQGTIPRWVDEGGALMADPPEKRRQTRAGSQAVAGRRIPFPGAGTDYTRRLPRSGTLGHVLWAKPGLGRVPDRSLGSPAVPGVRGNGP